MFTALLSGPLPHALTAKAEEQEEQEQHWGMPQYTACSPPAAPSSLFWADQGLTWNQTLPGVCNGNRTRQADIGKTWKQQQGNICSEVWKCSFASCSSKERKTNSPYFNQYLCANLLRMAQCQNIQYFF